MNETRRIRRRSLFGPLLLIILGMVFLLNNLGIFPGSMWNNLVRFWPVLLIIIGLDGIYRSQGLVGATFLIGLGVVFTLANLGWLALDVWQMVFRLWPVLLIAVGFDIVIGRRSALASFIGLLVVVAILVGALWLYNVGGAQAAAFGQEIRQPVEGARQAKITIAPAVGALQVYALEDSQWLVEGTAPAGPGTQLEHDMSQEGGQATFVLRGTGVPYSSPAGRSNTWNWHLGFTPQVQLELTINQGLGSCTLDLRGLQLQRLEASLGLGATHVILPKRGDYRVSIEGAIGQTTITIPESLGVRIRANTGIAGLSLPQGYRAAGEVFTSPNYEQADQRIEIEVGQAIGWIFIQSAGE